jgi:5-methylcytosine-specific restriction protein A
MTRLRPCIDCGHLSRDGTRCLACRRARDRRREQGRPSPAARGYGPAWTQLAAAVKAAWRAQHGDLCPGYEVPAHPIVAPNLLTVDHIVPKIQGGTDDPTNLAVLCKKCQGRKGRREIPRRG